MLSFTAMLDAERARGFAGAVAFRFGEMVYVARVASGAIEVRRGAADEGAALIAGEPTDVAAVVYGGAALDVVADRGRPDAGQALPVALHPASESRLMPTMTAAHPGRPSTDGRSTILLSRRPNHE